LFLQLTTFLLPLLLSFAFVLLNDLLNIFTIVLIFNFFHLFLFHELLIEYKLNILIAFSHGILSTFFFLFFSVLALLNFLQKFSFEFSFSLIALLDYSVGHFAHSLLNSSFTCSIFISSLLIFAIKFSNIFFLELDCMCFFFFLIDQSLLFFPFIFSDDDHGTLTFLNFTPLFFIFFLLESHLKVIYFFYFLFTLLAEYALFLCLSFPQLVISKFFVFNSFGYFHLLLQFVLLNFFLGFAEDHGIHFFVFVTFDSL
jgi:hypothetical protein